MKELLENILVKILATPLIIISIPFVIYREWKRQAEKEREEALYEESYLNALEKEIREDLKDKHHLK